MYYHLGWERQPAIERLLLFLSVLQIGLYVPCFCQKDKFKSFTQTNTQKI